MIFRVGIYLRLSREDGDKESDSIFSQRGLLKDYISSHPSLIFSSEYVDDGYTGTNFKRPGFQRLLEDCRSGLIDCILVKDLSRLGRNYLQLGTYLEEVFPTLNIRCIAINDNYDSLHLSANDQFVIPIKNIFNQQYAEDISRKVKSSFKVKQNQGLFIGAEPSYGYKKDPDNKNHLIIDESAALVVRRIFQLYISGLGKITIAQTLNKEGIPCPTEYKRLNGSKYRNAKRLDSTTYWTYSTIHKILTNQIYIGDMVQNKNVRSKMHSKAKILPASEWIIVKDTHEPIIDIATWNMVQDLLKRKARTLNLTSNLHLFAGFITCGNCGRSMVYSDKYYVCGTYKRCGTHLCSSHRVSEKFLHDLVLGKLNEQLSKLTSLPDIDEPQTTLKLDHSIQSLEQAKAKVALRKQHLYSDLQDGLIDKEEYLSFRKKYLEEEKQLEAQMELLTSQTKPSKIEWQDTLSKYKEVSSLSRAILAEILDKIIVTDNTGKLSITIYLKFEI